MSRQGSGSAIASSLVFVGIIAVLSLGAQATDFNVGGGDGNWTVPTSSNGLNYEQWASNTTFVTGDELVFKYNSSHHSVLRVSSQAYAACNGSTPIERYEQNDGDLDVELRNATTYYFICGFPRHCPAGQKFKIDVQPGAAVALKYSVSMIAVLTTLGSFLLFL